MNECESQFLGEELRRELEEYEHNIPSKIYYPYVKRFFDLIISVVIAVIFLIFILPFAALAIKLDSHGPVFFSQPRVGKHGKIFKVYKLRTMCANAEQIIRKRKINSDNPFIQKAGDRRVTRVGKVLRKLSIDELPQIFCVFKGDMSLIGPRPFIIDEAMCLTPEQLHRLSVKPGVTGLAQVNGRNDLCLEGRMEKDLYYINHLSFWLDLKIFFKTISTVISGKGAS